ncbi:autotransporter domain-containing protein [Luteibacter aegosomaticola]|uniref:autotransporter domain-containing protein n=1 Tax=Luteibacter aegosomaticola TaxID=2911538 RepID=UPI001FFBD31B|nr:autotransporter domain-containing protein [Luteibacter aegosomaticola]UPG89524.1 autotransporter domain-containing protein [Luteibacter aegosomaticola]
MNRIYRLVFNRALGVTQAVAEIATRAQGGASAQGQVSRPRQALLALCIGSALMVASGASFAQIDAPYTNGSNPALPGAGAGGSGSGTFGGGAGGGHAGNDSLAQPNSNEIDGSAGLTGDAGTGGAGGQNSLVYFSGDINQTSVAASGEAGSGTSGGGGGAAAIYLMPIDESPAQITISAPAILGGDGGAGGEGNSETMGGGGGGGGAAVVVANSLSVSNFSWLRGGTGGTGGYGAGGGGGGAGVVIVGDSNTFKNYDLITGGSGAQAGTGGVAGFGGTGLVISGNNNSVINLGDISGGMSGDGSSQGDAIAVTGNNNDILFSSTRINGRVYSAGTNNSLSFEGDGGGAADITGFSAYNANRSPDNANWTFDGHVSASSDLTFDVAAGNSLTFNQQVLTPGGITKTGEGQVELYTPDYLGTTTLEDGTLILHGGPAAAYQIDGGTLDLAGTPLNMSSLSGVGGKIVNGADLTLNLAADGSYGGDITSDSFEQTGTKVFTLTGTLETLGLAGATIDGTLKIGNGGAGGQLIGDVSGANGNVWFNRSDSVTYAGDASVHDLAQVGTGTLTLTGNNSTNWIDISGGTLRAGSAGALGHAIVTMADQTTFAFGDNLAFGNTFVLRGREVFDVGAGLAGTLSGSVEDANPNNLELGSTIYKNGAGTLVVEGNVESSHPMTVNAGTLVVGADSLTSANIEPMVYAMGGTTVGGNGTLSSLTSYSGVVSPGMGQIGTLTTGTLSVQNSHLAIDVGTPGVSDLLYVTGTADIYNSVVDVNDLGGLGLGVYRFMTVGGGAHIYGTEGLTLGATPLGSNLVLRQSNDENGVEFDLVNQTGAVLNYWNADGLASSTHAGGGTGTWSNTAQVFSDAEGNITSSMNPAPGFAIFGGAAGTVTVDGTDTPVAATGMQFLTDGYTLKGDDLQLVAADGLAPTIRVGDGTSNGAAITATIENNLTGTDGLRKTDAGTLVLSGQNTFTGGVVVNGGTLQVGDDSNLGDASNSVTLAGGTLHATNSVLTQRDFKLGEGDGTLDVDFGYTIGGTVSGTGALRKTGTGSLTLSGDNTYSGGTWIDAGYLGVASNGALGTGTVNMAENTGLVFLRDGINIANNIVVNGDPNLVVAPDTTVTLSGAIVDGTTPGDIVKSGPGTLRLTAANTYTGGTTVSQGNLIVGNGATTGSIVGDVLVKSAGTLTFDRSDATTFAGAISGEGTVSKLGTSMLTLSGDSSAFTGTTTVAGGVLNLTGSLGGSLVLAQNAILTGAGKLGEVTVSSGTSMTPGGDDAIGRFDVSGNLVFASGSTYVVNTAADGTSDTVNVTGTATLGGATVRSLQGTGSYKASTRYTLLTADAGVKGTFGTLTSNLAFLTPTLSYDTNHVYLDLLRNDTSFASLATNANQAATAEAVESQGSGKPVYDAVVALQTPAVSPALGQLAGVSLASSRTAMVDDARQIRETVQRHLLGTNDGGQTANGAWASAWGHWGDRDGSAGVDSLRSNGSGLLVGADHDLGGVTLGGTVGTGNLSARSGSDSVQGHSRVAGLYAAGNVGAWEWQAGAMYGWNRLESHRHVNVDGLAGNASARYDATTAQAYVDGGYRFTFTSGSLTPFVNVARVQLDQDGIHERNSDAALDVQGQNDGVTVGTAGVRGTLALGEGISAHATLGYQQAWGDVRPYDTQRFTTGGDSFTVAGAPLARHAGLADAGVTFAVARNTTVSASYHGLFGGGAKDQGARMALEVKW